MPRDTALDVRGIGDYRTSLFPQEAKAIARAVLERQHEFSTGRASARAAMHRLGLTSRCIPVGPDREPVWPPGYIGSITHNEGLCATVFRKRNHIVGIGIDLASADPLQVELRRFICTTRERQGASAVSASMAEDPHKMIFAAKEAVYKALFPTVGRFIDFHEVEIQWDGSFKTCRPVFISDDLKEFGATTSVTLLATDRDIAAVAWHADPRRRYRSAANTV